MVDWRHGDKIMSDLADEVERLAHQQCPEQGGCFRATIKPVEPDPFDAAVARSRRDIAAAGLPHIEVGFSDVTQPHYVVHEHTQRLNREALEAFTARIRALDRTHPSRPRIWPYPQPYQDQRQRVFLEARRRGATTDEAAHILADWEKTDEAVRLIATTIRDIEKGSFRKAIKPGDPPIGRIWPQGDRQAERGVRVGPVRFTAEPDGLHFARVERDPKGPLGLRWRLWWMRRRLWWMRARLDGGPARTLGMAGATAALGSTLAVGVMVLVDAPQPAMGWAYAPVAALLTWASHRGWRTPTVDKAIREAG